MARQNNYIDKIDKVLGNKIYSLRLAKGLSRQQLSNIIDVTHQQLSKYEQGKNRISVGRLVLISKALQKNVSYFYEDLESPKTSELITQHQRMAIEVSRNFMKIENTKHQEAVHILVKSLTV